MCPDVSRGPRLGTALGLILPLVFPLVLAGAAAAQSPGWVDPPAKTTAPKASSTETAPKAAPAANAPAASVPEESRPVQAATAPAAPSQTPASVETERDGAAMGGPSRRAERPRLRHRAARRLSDTPAADALTVAPRIPSGAPSGPREAAADPRFSDWAGQAQGLADDYLAAFSGPNAAMVAGASRFYAERVRFHGRMTTLAALLAEKRRFAQRWPERRYEPRDTRTACNAALQSCIVRTLVDFRAASPSRGARSQGVAELVLEVSFAGGRPVIVSESSRVLRRGATVGALSGAGASG